MANFPKVNRVVHLGLCFCVRAISQKLSFGFLKLNDVVDLLLPP